MVCQRPSLKIYFQQNSQFSRPRVNTVYHGTESISNLGPKICYLVPSNLIETSEMNLKKPLNNGNLRIVLVDCAKFLCKMSVSGKNNFKEVVI